MRVARRVAGNETAIAHDEHFVGDPFDFVELVRDVDDGDATVVELLNQTEEAFGFAGSQSGRRLVHDQQARLTRERFGDLDQLLLCDNQAAQTRARIDFQAHLFEHRRCLLAHRVLIQQPATLLFVAEKDILRNRQVFRQVELLVDEDNALGLRRARVAEMHRASINTHLSAGGCFIAGEDFHQSRLSRAVLAQQPVDSPRLQRKAHLVQDPHRSELFDDLVEFNRNAHRKISDNIICPEEPRHTTECYHRSRDVVSGGRDPGGSSPHNRRGTGGRSSPQRSEATESSRASIKPNSHGACPPRWALSSWDFAGSMTIGLEGAASLRLNDEAQFVCFLMAAAFLRFRLHWRLHGSLPKARGQGGSSDAGALTAKRLNPRALQLQNF